MPFYNLRSSYGFAKANPYSSLRWVKNKVYERSEILYSFRCYRAKENRQRKVADALSACFPKEMVAISVGIAGQIKLAK